MGVAVAKKMGVEPTERKVYGSIQTDNNPVITIHKKNDVKHLSELSPEDASAPNAWASQSPHRYYYDKYFDSRTKKISFTYVFFYTNFLSLLTVNLGQTSIN